MSTGERAPAADESVVLDSPWAPLIAVLRSAPGMQALVYRVAAGASLLTLAAMQVAADVETRHGSRSFAFPRSEFYATAAQVLPILLLTFATERRYFRRQPAEATSLMVLVAFAVVVFSVAIGEVFALVVLGTSDPSHSLKVWATDFAMAGTIGALALIAGQAALDVGVPSLLADVLENPEEHFERELAALMIAVGLAAAVYWIGAVLGDVIHRDPTTMKVIYLAVALGTASCLLLVVIGIVYAAVLTAGTLTVGARAVASR